MQRQALLIRRGNATNSLPLPAVSEKLFGKYDELARLVIGFLLTAVVGTYLSHRYTTQQADLVAAGKVFSEHSKLIGDRYFAQNQLTLALREDAIPAERDKLAEIKTRHNRYKEVVREWNSARGFNREMIKLYFGDRIWNTERKIHYAFRAWGQALESELKRAKSVDFKCLEEKSDELLVLVHSLRVDMAQAMQTGSVGGSRDLTTVEQSPRPDAYCLVSAAK